VAVVCLYAHLYADLKFLILFHMCLSLLSYLYIIHLNVKCRHVSIPTIEILCVFLNQQFRWFKSMYMFYGSFNFGKLAYWTLRDDDCIQCCTLYQSIL